MNDVWQRIETWLEANAPQLLETLNDGADDGKLDSLAETTGCSIPAPVRESYRIHDGQTARATPLLGEWKLLSVSEVRSRWQLQNEAFADDQAGDSTVDTDGPVQQTWWSAKWIPLLHNGAGDLRCVDLDPASGGTDGQVIAFWHTEPRREVLAADFGEFLEGFAADLEAGEYELRDGRLVHASEG